MKCDATVACAMAAIVVTQVRTAGEPGTIRVVQAIDAVVLAELERVFVSWHSY